MVHELHCFWAWKAARHGREHVAEENHLPQGQGKNQREEETRPLQSEPVFKSYK